MMIDFFWKSVVRKRSDFERIFLAKEYELLLGRRKSSLWSLSSILFLTFLALGFSGGSLENLKERIRNPFTNWVEIAIPNSHTSRKLDEVVNWYSKSEVKSRFQIQTIGGFNKFNLLMCGSSVDPFQDEPESGGKWLLGRTIDFESPLFSSVISNSEQVVWLSEDLKNPEMLTGFEIVVTEELLRLLGFESVDSVSHLCIADTYIPEGHPPDARYPNRIIFLRVVGVVRELPSLIYFASSPKLYNTLKSQTVQNKNCNDLVVQNKSGRNQFFIYSLPESGVVIDSLAKKYFLNANPSCYPNDQTYTVAGKTYQGYTLAFMPSLAPTLDTFHNFLQYLRNILPVKELTYLDFEGCDVLNRKSYHYLDFHFTKLNTIKSFQSDIEERFQIGVDMKQVKAGENFAMVSRLTFLLSTSLLGFGILSVVLFVNSLIRRHLIEMRANLGTFQAFGLKNGILIYLYSRIVQLFLWKSILIALIFNVIFQGVGYMIFGKSFAFNVLSYWVLLGVGMFVSIGFLVSRLTVHKLLNDTPGNLIYKR